MASLAHRGDLGQDAVQPGDAEPAARRPCSGRWCCPTGWDIMDFVEQLQKLAGGNVAFATIPVLDGGRLERRRHAERGAGRPARRCRTGSTACCTTRTRARPRSWPTRPAKTTADVVNDTDINGLAAAVSDVLTAKGFTPGTVGNNEGGQCPEQPGAGRQDRRPGRPGGRQGAGRAAGRRRRVGAAGSGAGGAGQRLHRTGFRARTAATSTLMRRRRVGDRRGVRHR